MRKIGAYIYIIFFSITISIPLVLFSLQLEMETPIGEKKMSLNFERNFPLKSNLISTFTYIKESVFDKNPLSKRVITVENNWKFLSNNDGNALSESKGIIRFTNSELKTLEERLLFRNKWLNDKGIELYLAIAPNKHTVYGNHVPIRQHYKKTKMEQLDSLCKMNQINYINLAKQFPKNSKKLLYFKTDTHWNEYGAFYGFKESIDFISNDFPNSNFNQFKINELIEITGDTFFAGDLNRILRKENNETYTALLISKEQQKAHQQSKQISIPKYFKRDPTKYEKRWVTNINNINILIFHDSFYHGLEKFMVENFKSTVSVWDHKFNEQLILSSKPDILYHEILERDVDVLLKY